MTARRGLQKPAYWDTDDADKEKTNDEDAGKAIDENAATSDEAVTDEAATDNEATADEEDEATADNEADVSEIPSSWRSHAGPTLGAGGGVSSRLRPLRSRPRCNA